MDTYHRKSEFTDLLHNDILVFNSTLNDVSEEMRKDYIDRLISVQAGGLIVSLLCIYNVLNRIAIQKMMIT